jgi:hypothetical protein
MGNLAKVMVFLKFRGFLSKEKSQFTIKGKAIIMYN